ncbi:hypothetical protein [Nostoc sp. FACHB-110]|uniref:hypothetical protein n=1 Tax=Nostoc sp. FACHB-110 TaxID=2692834 RepID=UPI001687ABF4|nr:hypothetical protein [Nostoc sp. FACHB-110]MBD2438270.1 hypothetical protein [Nostoc sp. FACHB-110]
MKQSKQQPAGKVVPFTGEFYPEVDTTPPATGSAAPYMMFVAAALIGGLSLGAIATYQSVDQVKLREMQAQSQQLEKVKDQVCR